MTSMERNSWVNVNLTGTPEQIRETYRAILDCLDDCLDIQYGAPVWSVELIHDTEQDHRSTATVDKVRDFMHQDLDGFLDRSSGPPGPEDIRTFGTPRTLGL